MTTIAPTTTLPTPPVVKLAISPRDLAVPAKDIAATPPTDTDKAAAPTAKATEAQQAEATPPAPQSTDQTTSSTYTAVANASASTIRGTNLNIQA